MQSNRAHFCFRSIFCFSLLLSFVCLFVCSLGISTDKNWSTLIKRSYTKGKKKKRRKRRKFSFYVSGRLDHDFPKGTVRRKAFWEIWHVLAKLAVRDLSGT